jgi:hypothetical protein
MIVRLEKTKNKELSLVIDENSKYLGKIYDEDFIHCMEDRDPFEEDDYLWFFVNKYCLMQNLDK